MNILKNRVFRAVTLSVACFATCVQPVFAAGYTFRVPLDPPAVGAQGGGALSYSDDSWNFGAVPINAQATHSFTVTNTGSATITLNGIGATGPGITSTTTCGSWLEVGASCGVVVRFAPSAKVTLTGAVTVSSDDSTPERTLALSGRGQAGTLTAGTHAFGPRQIDDAMVYSDITVQNISSAPVVVSSIDMAAGEQHFSQTNTCAGVIAAGGSCLVRVGFVPRSTGPLAGAVAIVSDSDESPTFVTVTGEGRSAAGTLTLEPFGNVQVGAKVTRFATLTNTGTGPLSIAGKAVTGDDYAETPSGSNTCGSSLSANGSCTFSVDFSPSLAGARPGLVSATTGAGTLTATPDGAGQPPNATLDIPAFGDVVAGTSVERDATLTNTGLATITVGTPAVTGSGYSIVSTTCGATLAAAANCKVKVGFSPVAQGSQPGNLSVATQAGVRNAALTANGQLAVLQLSAPTYAFGAKAVGGTHVSGDITLTNAGNLAASSVQMTFPAPYALAAGSTCSNGGALAAGASCTFKVQFNPTLTQDYPGTASFTTTAGTGSTANLALSGTGSGSVVVLTSAPAVSLASGGYGGAAQSGSWVFRNDGNSALTLAVSTATAPFSFANGCTNVAPGATCAIGASLATGQTGSFSQTGIAISGAALGNRNDLSIAGSITGSVVSVSSNSATALATPKGAAPASGVVTFANSGNAAVTLSLSGMTYPYALSTSSCLVNPGSTCSVTVSMATDGGYGSQGNRTLTASGASNGDVTTVVAGTLTGAGAVFAPSVAAFGTVQVGSTAGATVTLTNNGNVSADFSGAWSGIPANVSVNRSACGSVGAGSNCSVTLNWTPVATGAAPAASICPTSATTCTGLTLSGTAIAASGTLVSPAHGNVASGTTKDVTAVLTNTGVGPLAFSAVNPSSVTGTGFSFVSSDCGTSLGAGGTCNIVVRLTGSSYTAMSGQLSVATAAAGTLTAALSGQSRAAFITGIQGTAAFGNVQVGLTADSQTFTVQNVGNEPAAGFYLNPPAPYSIVGSSCPANGGTLAAGASCSFKIRFSPVSVGDASSSVPGGWTSPTPASGAIATTATGVAASVSTAMMNGGDTNMGTLGVGNDGGRWMQVTNNGAAPVTITSLNIGGAFSAWQGDPSNPGTCYVGNALSAGASCITYVFKSTGLGAGSYQTLQTWTMGFNSGSVAASTSVAGFRVNVGTVTANNVAFGSQSDGTKRTSAVTFTNTASSNPLRSVQVSFDSNPNGYFSVEANGCASGVPAGGSCTVTVGYAPAAWGVHSATLRLTGQYPRMVPGEDAQNGVAQGYTSSITGSRDGSVATLLTPTSMALDSGVYGSAAAYKAWTFRNDGNQPLNLSVHTYNYPFEVSNQCTNISPGQSCNVYARVNSVGGNIGSYASYFIFNGATVGNRSDLYATGTILGSIATGLNQPAMAADYSASNAGRPTGVVNVRNDGNYPMTLNNVYVDNTTEFAVVGHNCSNVAAGAQCQVTLAMNTNWYYSGGPTHYTNVYLNGSSIGGSSWAAGTTYAAEAQWQQASVDFGLGAYNSTTTRTAVVKNIGNKAFTPDGVVYNGYAPEMTSNAASVCPSVAPGASCTVTFSYTRIYNRGGNWSMPSIYLGPVPFGNNMTFYGATP